MLACFSEGQASGEEGVSDAALQRFSAMLSDLHLVIRHTLLRKSAGEVLNDEVKRLLSLKRDPAVPWSHFYQQMDTMVTGYVKLWGHRVTGSTHFARLPNAHSLTWHPFNNNNSRFQWPFAAIHAAPPPLWRAHHQRVAVATSYRPSRPMSSMESWLPIPLMKHAAVAGSVSSRDRAGELRQVIR